MKKETLNISCPNCGSSFSFDASRGKLKCEYCGYETAAEEMESFFLFDRKDGNDLEEKKNRNWDLWRKEMNHNEYSNTVNDPEFITGLTKAIKKDFRFYRIFVSTPFVIWIGFIIGVNQRIVFPYKTLIVYAVCIIVTIVIETIRIKHLNNGTWEGVVVHPNYPFKLEPSDKEKYGKLFCSMCGRENTISAIRCYKCGGVLLR